MKIALLISLFCLSTQIGIASELPPSPPDGADAGQEAFKLRLRVKRSQRSDRLQEIFAARRQADFEEGVHPPTIPEPQELSCQELQSKEDIDAILAKLKDQNNQCNCGNSKPKPQQYSGPKK